MVKRGALDTWFSGSFCAFLQAGLVSITSIKTADVITFMSYRNIKIYLSFTRIKIDPWGFGVLGFWGFGFRV